MQQKNLIIALLVLVVVGLVGWSMVTPKDTASPKNMSEKLSVVTTLFPLYDFAKAIGGEYVDATLLLPPGVEAHAFEPKPSDMVKIDQSDIFVYTGKAMEPWAEDMRQGIAKTVTVVDASQGITLLQEPEGAEHGHEDGHEGEHAFEWAGAFVLEPGEYTWSFSKVGGEYADPAMKMAILSSAASGMEAIEMVEQNGESLLTKASRQVTDGGELMGGQGYLLNFDNTKEKTSFVVKVATAGTYVFFTEHMPTEFEGDEHFFKNANGDDVEPVATEPEETGHHHHHGGMDPHFWLDFDNAALMVSSLEKAFIAKDPAHAESYRSNATLYRERLADLDQAYRNGLASCSTKEIVYGGHYAFGYLAQRYGLGYVAAQGLAPDAEPSAQDIALLVNQIRNNNIRFVFYEELTSPKIAETLARETKTEMLLLNAAHNVGKDDYTQETTFLGIMNENLVNLRKGLNCK